MNIVILCVGVGAWHPKGARRQREALEATGYHGAVRYWTGNYPPGSPTHQQLPYAFKAYAMHWAYKEGYDACLWMDASIWPQKSIQPILDHIEQHGYLIFRNGWTTGEWSTDEQLAAFGFDREQAMSIPHGVGGVIGVNFRKQSGLTIYEQYYGNAHLFAGSWTNERGQVSADPRVLGSRHDQTILSLIAHTNGYDFTPPTGWFAYYAPDSDAILLAQGM